MNNLTKPDELYHYGVIGMRWGIRRARRKGTDYTYKSHGQKKYEKKLAKQERKGASEGRKRVTKEKLETYKMRDRNRQDYVETTGIGRSIVKTLLMGPFGAGNYNRLRASGRSRLESAISSNVLSTTLGLPVSVLMSRGAEKSSAVIRKKGNAIR